MDKNLDQEKNNDLADEIEKRRLELEKDLNKIKNEERNDNNEEKKSDIEENKEDEIEEQEKENEEKSPKENLDDEESDKKIKEKTNEKIKSKKELYEDDELVRTLEDPFDGKVLIEDDLHDESNDEPLDEEKDGLFDDEEQREWHQSIIDAKHQTEEDFKEYHKEQNRFQEAFDKRTSLDPYAKAAIDKQNENIVEIDGIKARIKPLDVENEINKHQEALRNATLSEDALNRYYSGAYRKNLELKGSQDNPKFSGTERKAKENLMDSKYDFNQKSIKDLLRISSKKNKSVVNDVSKSKFNPEQLKAIRKVNKRLLLDKALLRKIDLEEVANIISNKNGINHKKLDKLLKIDETSKNEKRNIYRKNTQKKRDLLKNQYKKKRYVDKEKVNEYKEFYNNSRYKQSLNNKSSYINKGNEQTLNLNNNSYSRFQKKRLGSLNQNNYEQNYNNGNANRNKGLSAKQKRLENKYISRELSYQKYNSVLRNRRKDYDDFYSNESVSNKKNLKNARQIARRNGFVGGSSSIAGISSSSSISSKNKLDNKARQLLKQRRKKELLKAKFFEINHIKQKEKYNKDLQTKRNKSVILENSSKKINIKTKDSTKKIRFRGESNNRSVLNKKIDEFELGGKGKEDKNQFKNFSSLNSNKPGIDNKKQIEKIKNQSKNFKKPDDLVNSSVDKASEFNSNKENQTEEGKNAEKIEKRIRREYLKRSDAINKAKHITGKGIISASTGVPIVDPKVQAQKNKNMKMNKLDVVKGRNGKLTLARDASSLESKNVESGILSKQKRDARFLRQNRFDKIKENLEKDNIKTKPKKSATELFYDEKNKNKKAIDIGGSKDDDLLINKINSPYNMAKKESVRNTKANRDDKIMSSSSRVDKVGKVNVNGSKNLKSRSEGTFSSFLDKSRQERRMIDRFQSKKAPTSLFNTMGGTTGSFAPNPFNTIKKKTTKGILERGIIKKGLSSLMISTLAIGGSAGATMKPTKETQKNTDQHFDAISAKFDVEKDGNKVSFTQDVVDTAKDRMKVYYNKIAGEEVSEQDLKDAGNDIVPLKEIKVRKATLNGSEINPKSFKLNDLKNAKIAGGSVNGVTIKYRYVKEDWKTLIGKDNFLLDDYSDIQFPDGTAGPLAPEVNIGDGFYMGELRGKTEKKKVWNFFKDQKFSDAGVAGIMGNFALESGLDPTKKQLGGGPGRGLAQWEGPRWVMLQNKARQWGGNWYDLDIQLRFVMYELRSYPQLVHALKTASDPRQAAILFEQIYERAGVKAHASRAGYASQFYNERKSLSEPDKKDDKDKDKDKYGEQSLISLMDFLIPTAYADPDDKDKEDKDKDKDKDKKDDKDKELEAEDDENNTLPDTSGMAIMTSEESLGQVVFLKAMLSMSALGSCYEDPDDIEEYKKYCLDLVDFAVTGYGAKVNKPTADVDFISYESEDEEGHKNTVVDASVTINVMSNLKTLEENDLNFHKSWDLQIGGKGELIKGLNNGDKYGDRMPQKYMALNSEDFNEIFNVNIKPESYGAGTGDFVFEDGDFEGVTGIPYIDWAISIANNPAHGYSQRNRYENPDYDCSSLVWYSLKRAGFNLSGGPFATYGMERALTAIGFTWLPFSKSALKPGDICLEPNSHTEMYVGGGKTVGAHSSYEQMPGFPYGIHGTPGDQTGKEISVAEIKYYCPYTVILRPPASYMEKVKQKQKEKDKEKDEKKKEDKDD